MVSVLKKVMEEEKNDAVILFRQPRHDTGFCRFLSIATVIVTTNSVSIFPYTIRNRVLEPGCAYSGETAM